MKNALATKAATGISGVKGTVTRAIGKVGGKLAKHSPEIALGAGVVAVVGGAVCACVATTKLELTVDELNKKRDEIEEARERYSEEEYTQKDYTKDKALVTARTVGALVKLYGPSVALMMTGIGLIFVSHGIMSKRNAALVAAYNGLETAFEAYRGRVIEAEGEEADYKYMYGVEKKPVLNAKTGGEDIQAQIIEDSVLASPYARFFDESNPNWVKNAEFNMMFLNSQQNYANNKLRATGHLFLNEVYDMLGIPHSQAGAIVGWVLGQGDDFVDFGIYNVHRKASREFVNGDERSVLLDFNVSGVIYDLI